MSAPNQNVPKPPALYRALAAVLGPLEKLLRLDCRSFTRLASAGMDRALTLGERVRYRLHRLICAICRAQDNRNRCLHELFTLADNDGQLDEETRLTENTKEKIRRRLTEESRP
ncbi:MAG: hypothetical protein RL380_1807 [Verrucomicrobiota bacterium]|jgi:hypothetical protein